jgi:hypothetical protein
MENSVYFNNAKKNLGIRLLIFLSAFTFIIVKAFVMQDLDNSNSTIFLVLLNVMGITTIGFGYLYKRKKESIKKDGDKLDNLKNYLGSSGYFLIAFEAIALFSGVLFLITFNKIFLVESILFCSIHIFNHFRRIIAIETIKNK